MPTVSRSSSSRYINIRINMCSGSLCCNSPRNSPIFLVCVAFNLSGYKGFRFSQPLCCVGYLPIIDPTRCRFLELESVETSCGATLLTTQMGFCRMRAPSMVIYALRSNAVDPSKSNDCNEIQVMLTSPSPLHLWSLMHVSPDVEMRRLFNGWRIDKLLPQQ